jgi:hypothetical protein
VAKLPTYLTLKALSLSRALSLSLSLSLHSLSLPFSLSLSLSLFLSLSLSLSRFDLTGSRSLSDDDGGADGEAAVEFSDSTAYAADPDGVTHMPRVRTPFEYCEDVFDGIYECAARALIDWDALGD